MTTSNTWVICESSGRWTAALRVALARKTLNSKTTPRILEVRSLAELNTAVGEHTGCLGLVEIRPDNLADALEFLTKARRQRGHFVALLDDALRRQPVVVSYQHLEQRFVADALLEAGALEVIDSPRTLSGVFDVAERHVAWYSRHAAPAREFEGIADRAWAALPWQDG